MRHDLRQLKGRIIKSLALVVVMLMTNVELDPGRVVQWFSARHFHAEYRIHGSECQ